MRLLLSTVIILMLTVYGAHAAEPPSSQATGVVVMVNIPDAKDGSKTVLWPFLLSGKELSMLVGSPDILEELTYLSLHSVTLNATALPKQKINDKEFASFAVKDIVTFDGEDYLTASSAVKEFAEALANMKNYRDGSKELMRKDIVSSLWFDKNTNGVLDTKDRLFVTARSAGRTNQSFTWYPAKAIIRNFIRKTIVYTTFNFRDPQPQNYEAAVLGKVKYDNTTCTLEVAQMHADKEGALRSPQDDEKTMVLIIEKGAIQNLVNKWVLLTGAISSDSANRKQFTYDTILWVSETKENITMQNGQYLLTLKGTVSIAKRQVQTPWELSIAYLKSTSSGKYDLRMPGYVGYWGQKPFNDVQLTITGALRPIEYYDATPTNILEALSMQ